MNIAFVKSSDMHKIAHVIKGIHRKNRININIYVCHTNKELLMLAVQTQIDIAIINEQNAVEDMDGYDIAYRLKIINSKTLPIMIKYSPDQAINEKAGKAELFGYILSEQIFKELPKLINYAIKRIPQEETIICYYWYGVVKEAKLQDIIYFCSNHRLIAFKQINGAKAEFYQKLDEIEKILKKENINWLRANKSFLVNPQYIDLETKNEIVLYNGEIITLSKKYQDKKN